MKMRKKPFCSGLIAFSLLFQVKIFLALSEPFASRIQMNGSRGGVPNADRKILPALSVQADVRHAPSGQKPGMTGR
jgi:hypothetical protein